jgi:hypothetical protein
MPRLLALLLAVLLSVAGAGPAVGLAAISDGSAHAIVEAPVGGVDESVAGSGPAVSKGLGRRATSEPGDRQYIAAEEVRVRPSDDLVAPKVPAVGDDLLEPGPWATESVPSSAPGKITQAERDLLNPIGDASGCHSCGSTTPGTKSGNWIGDHQPVSRTVEPGTPQVLYPHCQTCSNDQGLWIINLIRQGKL